jgi:hypothetical protein
MRIAMIVIAILLGLLGLRLLLTALRTIIMFFKVDDVPFKAKERLFRDLIWGGLCVALAAAMLI